MRRLVARCAVPCGLLLVTAVSAQPPAKSPVTSRTKARR